MVICPVLNRQNDQIWPSGRGSPKRRPSLQKGLEDVVLRQGVSDSDFCQNLAHSVAKLRSGPISERSQKQEGQKLLLASEISQNMSLGGRSFEKACASFSQNYVPLSPYLVDLSKSTRLGALVGRQTTSPKPFFGHFGRKRQAFWPFGQNAQKTGFALRVSGPGFPGLEICIGKAYFWWLFGFWRHGVSKILALSSSPPPCSHCTLVCQIEFRFQALNKSRQKLVR